MPQLYLRPEPTSPGKSRAFVRELLVEWGVGGEVVEDAELLVSELVTNAIIHAGTGATVDVDRYDGNLQFAVSDKSARPVQLRLPSVEAVTGRGVYFLDQLAPDWEVEPTANGKTVRFTLPVDADSKVAR